MLSLIAAVWVLFKVFQFKMFEWLRARPPACCAVLGLWWWSCFVLSWLGLLLLGLAVILALRMHARKPSVPPHNVAASSGSL